MFILELVRPVGLHAVAPRVDNLVAADAPHLAPEAACAAAAADVARPEAQPGRDRLVVVAAVPAAAVPAVEQLNQVYILGDCISVWFRRNRP